MTREPRSPYAVYGERVGLFLCPLCRSPFSLEQTSLVCQKGHTYDISKRQTVNFLPNQGKTQYHARQFSARGRIFEGGYYDGLLSLIGEMIPALAPDGGIPVFLDAGCGEGFLLRSLERTGSVLEKAQFIGLDLEKEAIALAGKHRGSSLYWVADLANIPLVDGCVDGVFNLLSPANYREFLRVLKPEGWMLKVVPGDSYLQEFRREGEAPYTNDGVLSLFGQQFPRMERRTWRAQVPVSPEVSEDFFSMTPLTRHQKKEAFDFERIRRITLHLDVLLGRKRVMS